MHQSWRQSTHESTQVRTQESYQVPERPRDINSSISKIVSDVHQVTGSALFHSGEAEARTRVLLLSRASGTQTWLQGHEEAAAAEITTWASCIPILQSGTYFEEKR